MPSRNCSASFRGRALSERPQGVHPQEEISFSFRNFKGIFVRGKTTSCAQGVVHPGSHRVEKRGETRKAEKGCCKVQACFTCRESEAQCCDQAWRFIRWGKARRDQQAGSKIGYHWSSYQPGDLCGDRAVEGDIPWGAIFWLGHQSGKGQDIAASGSSREVREGDGWMAQGGGKVQSKSGSKVMVLQISIVEQPCWVTFEPSVAPFLVDVTTKVEDL